MTDSEKLDLLLSEMTGMKSEMQGMKSEMQSMKSEMQSMKSEMQSMKSEMQSMKSEIWDIKEHVKGIELHLENETDRNIQILAENHISLVDKLNESIKVADKTALYEIHVRTLTNKVDKLSKDVANLKLCLA